MAYVIGACGFCATGSSAITDFLKEFDEVVTFDDFEFTLPYRTDGLMDLRYHLHEGAVKHNACWIAIERFRKLCNGYGCRELIRDTKGKFKKLTEEYLNSIIQAEWIGTEVHESEEMFRSLCIRTLRKLKLFKHLYKIERKYNCKQPIFPFRNVTFSTNPDKFDEITKNYVMSILYELIDKKDHGKSIVLDQPFVGGNPQATFPFFENPKAIITDRDPRDYYVFYKEFLYQKGRRAVPVYDVKNFVTFYRKERENMPYTESHPDILNVKFEDLIYKYEETANKICEFCGLDFNNRKRKLFDPELSINNTQVYKRYPQYAEDIVYIEEHLSEYLYPFEDFGEKVINGQMFLGRSPLNKK